MNAPTKAEVLAALNHAAKEYWPYDYRCNALDWLREQIERQPSAYGYPNTAITGSGPSMMMLRHEVPADDQYNGAFWLPLYALPFSEEKDNG